MVSDVIRYDDEEVTNCMIQRCDDVVVLGLFRYVAGALLGAALTGTNDSSTTYGTYMMWKPHARKCRIRFTVGGRFVGATRRYFTVLVRGVDIGTYVLFQIMEKLAGLRKMVSCALHDGDQCTVGTVRPVSCLTLT
jgi:hypothetical protein